MNTTVEFDSATFSDALMKAARVAPSKGRSFDKAAGIMFRLVPGEPVLIQATDLETTYCQKLSPLEFDGLATAWRIPSGLISGLCSSLPLGEGHTIKMMDRGDGWVYVTSGDMVAKLAVMRAEDFPLVDLLDVHFPPMSPAQEFAAKVAQVAWSVDKSGGGALSGVHIDGTRLWATDRYTLASVPCEVPLTDPVTAPLFTLGGLLKSATDVRLRAVDKRLEMSLDAETTATSVLLQEEYPDIGMLLRDEFMAVVEFSRTEFTESLDRILVLAAADAIPRLGLTIAGKDKKIVFDMDIPNVGRMRDAVPFVGDFDGWAEMFFAPTRIRNAVNGSTQPRIKIQFGKPESCAITHPAIFRDVDDYQCLVSQTKEAS